MTTVTGTGDADAGVPGRADGKGIPRAWTVPEPDASTPLTAAPPDLTLRSSGTRPRGDPLGARPYPSSACAVPEGRPERSRVRAGDTLRRTPMDTPRCGGP